MTTEKWNHSSWASFSSLVQSTGKSIGESANSILSKLILFFLNRAPFSRSYIWTVFFDYVATATYRIESWTMMNYGYCPTSHDQIRHSDEPELYCQNLYNHVVSTVDLHDSCVLEVGCGRGGGAVYLKSRFRPIKYVGLDISSKQIAFCRAHHSSSGVKFVTGDALNLQFSNQAFDYVVNIESSFCYRSFDFFLDQVSRVLRPGGKLLFADLRLENEISDLYQSLETHRSLRLLTCSDISENVLLALERDSERRRQGVLRLSPRSLRRLMMIFSGVHGTRIPRKISDKTMIYVSAVLEKE